MVSRLFSAEDTTLNKSFAESNLFLKSQLFKLLTLFVTSLGLELSNDTHFMGQFDRSCWKIYVRQFEKNSKKKIEKKMFFFRGNHYLIVKLHAKLVIKSRINIFSNFFFSNFRTHIFQQ